MLRKKNSIRATLLLTLCILNDHHSTAQAQPCPTLTWSDEFNGSSLDETLWTPQLGDGCEGGPNMCGWGNNEAQWYRSENVEVSAGTLKIIAKKEDFQGKAFTSSRLRTFGKVEFDLTNDMLIEARIKVPDAGMGIWPAFWMMPSPEVTWPLGGEIDMMEFIGREPFFAHGYMHYGPAFGDKTDKGGPIRLPEPVFEDFHIFAIVKTNNKIAYLLDGHEYQSYTPDDVEPKYSWPFERTYHLLLNVAVGGNWPGYPDATTTFPSTMEVDYVRVYDMSGGKTVPLIDGIRLVHQNEAQVEYCVANAFGNAVDWSAPDGASFTPASKPDCILVDFGTSSGYIKATVTTTCTDEGTYTVSIPVEVQPFYSVDSTIFDPTVMPTVATGTFSAVTVDGRSATEYIRSSELYDNIQIDVTLSDVSDFLTGARKFFLT